VDATLVTGLLTIAGTLASGVLAAVGFVARRFVSSFDTLTANDTKKTEHLGVLAAAVQTHALRLERLEDTVIDTRQSDATAAAKAATAAMQSATAIITGKHAAVDVQRAALMGEEAEEEPRTVRPRQGRGSRPG